jgi:hypothetical protein
MKKRILAFTVLLLVSFIVLGGCSSNKSGGGEEASTIVEEALAQGKLALADADVEKAKSNFNLALKEDVDNKEAKGWLDVIGKYELFVTHIANHEIEPAKDTLNEFKKDENYDLLSGILKEHEQSLDLLVTESKKLDEEIEDLWTLYDPEDENSMPDETYLVRVDEILASPNLSDEQRKAAEKFKADATERANNLLAKEAEEQKAAKAQEQKDVNPYEWGSGIKEQFEADVVNRGYADSSDTIRYEPAYTLHNEGYLTVYAEMDGVEYRILTVNVKTGDFTGL